MGLKKLKYLVILCDGMADLPIKDLGNRTPLEYAKTPYMDKLAKKSRLGTLLTLPRGLPDSSDVANLSILGYNLSKVYQGRGPIEAAAMGIKLGNDDIAFRANLIYVENNILKDYSANHISESDARNLIEHLDKYFHKKYKNIRIYPGVSYRNLLVISGKEFSPDITYSKPDSSHGESIYKLFTKPAVNTTQAKNTSDFINHIIRESINVLIKHQYNKDKRKLALPEANMLWPWSPGKHIMLDDFNKKYSVNGGVITAVDVIKGIAKLSNLAFFKVKGATGYIDTNYLEKAKRAINEFINGYDFIYLHIEATDEVSHLGDLDNKIKAIENIDKLVLGTIMEHYNMKNISISILPDHPVPVLLRKHTRTPVPVMIYRPGIKGDGILYNEETAEKGSLGKMKGKEFIETFLKR